MSTRFSLMLVGCVAAAGITALPQAQEPGFTPLFNGKDLTG
jgi:hypothetical protein